MAEIEDKKRGRFSRSLRQLRAAGPRQLAITFTLLVLAFALARYSWDVPVLADAERSFYDVRSFVTADQVDQDDRLQVVVYTDQTLIAARKRSPLDRGLLARTLRNIDGMGAKSIGIDILFDQPQDEDDDLVETLRTMKTPTFVAYADVEGNAENIIFDQQQYLDAFQARLKGSNARPASIRLDYANGVTRNWPDILDRLPPLLGRAMIAAGGEGEERQFAGHEGSVRYRLPADPDRPVFSSLPIDLFADPETATAMASQIAGRYVLIGGDIVDVDRAETPFTATTGESIPGIEVHAAMIAQMLDGTKPPRLAGWQLTALALLVLIAAALTSLIETRFLRQLPFLIVQVALFGGLPFLIEQQKMDSQLIPAVGWGLGWIVAFSAVGSAARASGAEQRKFAQSALGKYLPVDIAQQIIDNPDLLALYGKKQEIYILFSDLEGFTALSHDLEPEVVARLLNDYLETLSQVVLDHGGVIDKFVGDAVVAFWGAPIAREDDAEKAARAGYALWQAGEEFRRRHAGEGIPAIGRTRVGLHFGDAVVGNFGGEKRIQYTALGDAMNTAARLESANKSLGSTVLVSREFMERSSLDWWRPMGRVQLRGRFRPVDTFEPAPDFPEEDRQALFRAMDLIKTDKDAATSLVAEVAAKHSTDKALQNLLLRLGKLTEDNAYVMA